MIFFLGAVVQGSGNNSMNIGAIIDLSTRVGKEQKTAMIIAADYFNNFSSNHKLIIHFREISNDPIQAVSSGTFLFYFNITYLLSIPKHVFAAQLKNW